MKKPIFILFIALLTLSCNSEKSNKQQASDQYDWLIGSWQPDNDPTRLETWNKLSSLAYTGIGLKHVGTDSMRAFEYLRLFKLDDKWQYTAQVQNQNNGQEITFAQKKKATGKVLKVENLSHDFPKTIEYQYMSDRIIGVSLNKGLEGEYNYKCLKQD